MQKPETIVKLIDWWVPCHALKSTVSAFLSKSLVFFSHTFSHLTHTSTKTMTTPQRKKKKKKKRKGELSIVEQRLLEAQEAVDRQEKEEKRRIFEAWTHGFDEDGVLFYSNSVLKKNQYEKPKRYKTGKLPTPAEHLWEDVFQKIDKKKRGAITEDDIKAVRRLRFLPRLSKISKTHKHTGNRRGRKIKRWTIRRKTRSHRKREKGKTFDSNTQSYA